MPFFHMVLREIPNSLTETYFLGSLRENHEQIIALWFAVRICLKFWLELLFFILKNQVGAQGYFLNALGIAAVMSDNVQITCAAH